MPISGNPPCPRVCPDIPVWADPNWQALRLKTRRAYLPLRGLQRYFFALTAQRRTGHRLWTS